MTTPRNRRPGFSRRAQFSLFLGYVGLVGGAIVGVALLLLSTFNPSAGASLRRSVAEITTPISSGLAWVGSGASAIPAWFGSHFAVRSENAKLKKQIADNDAIVARARAINQENRALRDLLEVREATSDAVVIARLVNSSASSTRRYATLNAGTRQGVESGQPVREADGLIGQVIETGFNSARVLLITDAESLVPVRRTRDGLPAIAAGRGDGLLDIRSASISNVDFRAGDEFVTSGTGGVFAPNIPVARIVKGARDNAVAQPNANPDSLSFAQVQRPFLPEPVPSPSPTAKAKP